MKRLLPLLALAACGPAAVSEVPCLALGVPEGQALSTSAPSKVSVLFTAQTCNGTPLTNVSTDQLTLEEDNRPLSAFESHRVLTPRAEASQVNSLLLLDLSGSILESGAFDAMANAAGAYIDAVTAEGGQRMALATFDGRADPQVLTPFTADRVALQAGLASLRQRQCTTNRDCPRDVNAGTCAGWRCVDESTDLNGAVLSGLSMLDEANARASGVPYRDSALVLFTDGADQAGRVSSGKALQAVRGSASHVFTVAFGPEADQQTLGLLGKSGAFQAKDSAQLLTAFDRIANSVRALANRYYQLEYCSPKRGGTHTLTVRLKIPTPLGTQEGTLTRAFDATGFTSGCEL